MTFSLRTLFACWLTVVAISTDVAHRHAAGSGHTHGFGWVSVEGPSGAALFTHHHFVLCGIEFGAEWSDPVESPESGPHPVLTADSLPAQDTDTVSADHHDVCFDFDFGATANLLFLDSGRFFGSNAQLCTAPLPPARSHVLRL